MDKTIDKVMHSPKYANIGQDFVRWVIQKESKKYKNNDAVIRSVRSKLHQAATSYLQLNIPYSQLLLRLKDLPQVVTDKKIKDWCQTCMQLHASSAERLPILGEFYDQIFAALPKVTSILDIACGFNPLAIPWMPNCSLLKYIAVDIFEDQSNFLNEFFDHCHLNATSYMNNIMGDIIRSSPDTVLLLKVLPIIEQLEKDSTVTFLQRLNAPNIVISYPVKSLGGKNKGMRENYANQFKILSEKLKWPYTRLDFLSELVFIVKR